MAVNKMAVVGCGTMGSGIIQVAAHTGIEVVGIETSEANAERAYERINAGLEGAVVNTAGLKGLKVTIASATAIVDGLHRGRTKLGG